MALEHEIVIEGVLINLVHWLPDPVVWPVGLHESPFAVGLHRDLLPAIAKSAWMSLFLDEILPMYFFDVPTLAHPRRRPRCCPALPAWPPTPIPPAPPAFRPPAAADAPAAALPAEVFPAAPPTSPIGAPPAPGLRPLAPALLALAGLAPPLPAAGEPAPEAVIGAAPRAACGAASGLLVVTRASHCESEDRTNTNSTCHASTTGIGARARE